MTGIVAGHRASWWGVAMASFVLAVVLLAARPLAAQAAPLGSQDGSYGNDQPQPYAVLYGPGQSAYRPGKLVALPDGESLVADGSVLGVTKLTEEGAPNLSFGNFGTGGAKRGTAVVGGSGESSASAVAVTPSGSDYVVAGESSPVTSATTWPRPRRRRDSAARTVAADSTLAVAEFTSEGELDTSFASTAATPGVLEYQTPAGQSAPVRPRQPTSPSSRTASSWSPGQSTSAVPESPRCSWIGSPAKAADRNHSRCRSKGSPPKATPSPRARMGRSTSPPRSTPARHAPRSWWRNWSRPAPPRTLHRGLGHASAPADFVRSTLHLELDPSFDAGGPTPGELTTTLGGSSADVDTLAVAPDGDLLIGGQTGAGTGSVGVVARITPAGTLDETFGSDGVASARSSEGSGCHSSARSPSSRVARR